MANFEDHGLKGGTWRGVYRDESAPGRIALVHLGEVIALASLKAAGEGAWRVEVAVPPAVLSDGATTLILIADDAGEDQPPKPEAQHFARLQLLAGSPLNEDLAAEIVLMRAELDLLKREFRRLLSDA